MLSVSSTGVVSMSLLRPGYRDALLSPVNAYLTPARRQADELGLVREWMLIGPFENDKMAGHDQVYPPETEITLDAVYEGKAGPVRWRLHRNPDWDGYIDLARLIEPNERACAYALCYVTAVQPTRAQLRTGSNDSLAVWLGAQKVLDRKVLRGANMDDDIVEVTIPAGTTPILVKVCQTLREWGFYLRVTDAEGQPLSGLRFSTRP